MHKTYEQFRQKTNEISNESFVIAIGAVVIVIDIVNALKMAVVIAIVSSDNDIDNGNSNDRYR